MISWSILVFQLMHYGMRCLASRQIGAPKGRLLLPIFQQSQSHLMLNVRELSVDDGAQADPGVQQHAFGVLEVGQVLGVQLSGRGEHEVGAGIPALLIRMLWVAQPQATVLSQNRGPGPIGPRWMDALVVVDVYDVTNWCIVPARGSCMKIIPLSDAVRRRLANPCMCRTGMTAASQSRSLL